MHRILLTYTMALLPLLIVVPCSFVSMLPTGRNCARERLPLWVLRLYVAFFFVCALGWEIWFTFGIIPPGASVSKRRCPTGNESGCTNNQQLPEEINWIVCALADAGCVCMVGILIVYVCSGREKSIAFTTLTWSGTFCVAIWFIGQNVLIEYLIEVHFRVGGIIWRI